MLNLLCEVEWLHSSYFYKRPAVIYSCRPSFKPALIWVLRGDLHPRRSVPRPPRPGRLPPHELIIPSFYLLFRRQAVEEADGDPGSPGRRAALSGPDGAVETLSGEALLQLEIQRLVRLQVWGQCVELFCTDSRKYSRRCCYTDLKVSKSEIHFYNSI